MNRNSVYFKINYWYKFIYCINSIVGNETQHQIIFMAMPCYFYNLLIAEINPSIY